MLLSVSHSRMRRHGTVGALMQVLANEPSDYSYFKPNLLRTWAGPGHWKPAPRLKGQQAEHVSVHNFFL